MYTAATHIPYIAHSKFHFPKPFNNTHSSKRIPTITHHPFFLPLLPSMFKLLKLLAVLIYLQLLVDSVSCTLEPRECPTSSCSCQGVVDGPFCGDGRYNCKQGRLYECQGGAQACDYGVNDNCTKCNHLTCETH